MAYTYRIYPSRRFSIVFLSGPITGKQIEEAAVALVHDAAWQPGSDTLWDYREVTEFILEMAEIRSTKDWTARLQPRIGGGKAAALAVRPIDYEAVQVLMAYTRSGREAMKVFQSLPEAVTWLGIPEELTLPG